MQLEDKYIVLKRSDIDLALTRVQKMFLSQMCADIASWRDAQNKPINKYVVINQDEPYFQEVLKLMDGG